MTHNFWLFFAIIYIEVFLVLETFLLLWRFFSIVSLILESLLREVILYNL